MKITNQVVNARLELNDVFAELTSDVVMIDRYLNPGIVPEEDRAEDHNKRLNASARFMVRTQISTIEAIFFQIKNIVCAVETEYLKEKLLAEEQLALSNVEVQVLQGGKVRRTSMRVNFLNDFEFSIHIFTKVFDIDFALEKDGNGWEYLKKTIKVRDRLTHPKGKSGIRLSMEELNEASEAYGWFTAEISRLLKLFSSKIIELEKEQAS